jgi:hypothetical protein
MSQILTKEQICALYRAKNYEELVAFGARVVNKPARIVKHRTLTLDDYGTPEFEAHQNSLLKTPSKPVTQAAVEPDVEEQIF